MGKPRIRYVAFDPSFLEGKRSSRGTDDEKENDAAEAIRNFLMRSLANGELEQYLLLIHAANWLLDDEAIRRDGFNKELAAKLGISEGQASRLWRDLLAAMRGFDSARQTLAASLAKLVA